MNDLASVSAAGRVGTVETEVYAPPVPDVPGVYNYNLFMILAGNQPHTLTVRLPMLIEDLIERHDTLPPEYRLHLQGGWLFIGDCGINLNQMLACAVEVHQDVEEWDPYEAIGRDQENVFSLVRMNTKWGRTLALPFYGTSNGRAVYREGFPLLGSFNGAMINLNFLVHYDFVEVDAQTFYRLKSVGAEARA